MKRMVLLALGALALNACVNEPTPSGQRQQAQGEYLDYSGRLDAAEDYQNPRYMELLMAHHYVDHILRMPLEEWPDPVDRALHHINPAVYIPLQGPSELGASGKVADWDRTGDLGKIAVPTLVIGARYDTMDPAHMEKMASQVQKGRYLFCPHGSHMAMYDDQKIYMDGVIQFIHDVDAGRF